jgi:hypothetical protein
MKSRANRSKTAFTLMEVLIASAIFFMSLILILSVVSGSLRTARALQHHTVDASLLAAELFVTNNSTMLNAPDSGDFGDLYPDYNWLSDPEPAGTNGLFEVTFVVSRRNGDRGTESKLTVLRYDPTAANKPRF